MIRACSHRAAAGPPAIVDEAGRRGFAGIALLYASTTDALVARGREAGLLVWTINEPAELAHGYERDVRWIETARPDLAPKR